MQFDGSMLVRDACAWICERAGHDSTDGQGTWHLFVCKQLKLALFLYILVATAPVDVSYP